MTPLILKVTFIFTLALALQLALKRSSAAMRHLLCAAALLSGLLMPLTLAVPVPVLTIPMPVFAAVATGNPAPAGEGWGRFLAVLPWIWALGWGFVMSRLAAGLWRVWRIRHTARQIEAVGSIPVYEANVAVPVAVGLVNPAILLPPGSADWQPAHRTAALRHEAAHIGRKDLWTNMLAHLVCATYWFHPLAWAVAHRLREEQELACDDAALTAGTPPEMYAEALLAAARSARPYVATSMIGCHMITRTPLQNRIARLLATNLPRTSSMTALRRMALGSAAAALCVGLLSAVPQAGPAGASDPAEKVYRVGGNVTAPKLLSKVEPEYTEEATAARIDGTVLLRIVIRPDGTAHDINVEKGLDFGLDLKAVEAVQKWRFQPGTLDGHPVAVSAMIEINFRLK